MKIILTGSLGHISKPLAVELLQSGHSVTIISSNPEKQTDIEALGATPAIGSVGDKSFLAKVFSGADAAYCMTPPNFSSPDQISYYENIADCYAEAIRKSQIRRVVYLSSYGAHLASGTGFITGSYRAEKILDSLPVIQLTYIRPTYFYYNLFGYVQMMKSAGFIGAVFGGEDKIALVAPNDIALAVAEELTKPESTLKVRYVASDDRTCNEIARVLGKAIGIPDLEWRTLPEEQVMQSLVAHGVPENAAMNLVEMGKATRDGRLREDFDRNPPEFGKVLLEDFAQEFAAIYNQ